MKRKAALILFVIMLIVLAVSICFCVYSIVDLYHESNRIANDPSSSGIDFFGLGWEHGIALFMLSISGLFFSIISTKMSKKNSLKYISFASVFLFGALIMASFLIFHF